MVEIIDVCAKAEPDLTQINLLAQSGLLTFLVCAHLTYGHFPPYDGTINMAADYECALGGVLVTREPAAI